MLAVRVVIVVCGLAYAFWNLHHEYSLKYLYAGSLNMAVWRSLNATAAERTDLSRVPDAELSIPRHPAKCADGLTKIDLPADCDLFGGDFGGKSRNCPYWWLGRKCYVFYLPERIYREPELRAPILQALERPCDFLFDPAFAADGTEETIRKFDRRARNAFGCNGQLLPLQQEVKVYVIDENDRYTVETVVMKL